jgi:cation diffusion facilitator CzcD-associated flavoprotein CzcO
VTHHRIAIIGSGFSGIGMAIRLKRDGEHDFVILERAGDLGGTWRDNTYPGCRCDVPSHLYSFSFEPNPNWSNTFSGQQEIWDYLRGCAERHGVVPHMRFDHDVHSAEWDAGDQLWRLETSQGPITAEVLVAGQGGLSAPSVPDLPGLDRFEGATFHSAQWDHEHELAGERVAVIGTGASAIQFVPQIQPLARQLHVFQRTAPWVLPHAGRPLTRGEHALYRALPQAQLAMRAGVYGLREILVLAFRHRGIGKALERRMLKHLYGQVADPELRAKLEPQFALGCKRLLPSNEWYPTLTKPNVELVTEGIQEIRERSIVSADGTEREVDTIIFGTGFHVTDNPIAELVGNGRQSLGDVWAGSMNAYKGTTVAGFPNLFLLSGPNTAQGHTSLLYMIESQLNYVIGALRSMRRQGVRALEVRADAQAAYTAKVQDMSRGTVWVAGGCESWYLDSNGRNATIWPTFTWPFRQQLREFDEAAYTVQAPRPASEPVAA